MAIQVRNAGAWQAPPAGRLIYFRINGQWKPILDLWVRDQGAWHKEPTYTAPQMSAPTNLRMNPASPTLHTSFQIAWDWNQPANGLPVGDFEVVLTNNQGGWLVDVAVSAATRSYNFTGLNQSTQYQAYVRARYPGGGRAESPWAGPLRWAMGADSYVVYDQPVYNWANEFEWCPPYYYTYSSAANGDGNTWGFAKAIDQNFSSYWNSDIVTEPDGSGNQGEGWMVQAPSGSHYLFRGIRVWNLNPHTVWMGIYANGAWQGGNQPYTGKYSAWRIPYVAGVDRGAGANLTVRGGDWDIDAYGGLFIAGLHQFGGYDGYNFRMTCIELRLLLMSWTVVGYNPRTVPAVNSAAW